MKGLMHKYNISKADGTPVKPEAKYFVLRYDDSMKDEMHKQACREALGTYAICIRPHLPELAKDLLDLPELKGGFTGELLTLPI